jgi:hypothetical protein
MAIQFNYLLDRGAFAEHGDGAFSVDMMKIKGAVQDLDHDLLTLEAEGNYSGAKEMLDKMGVLRPVLSKTFENLKNVPTDIEPIFVTAEELAPTASHKPAENPKPIRRRSTKKK